jgi:hypothetical protein
MNPKNSPIPLESNPALMSFPRPSTTRLSTSRLSSIQKSGTQMNCHRVHTRTRSLTSCKVLA